MFTQRVSSDCLVLIGRKPIFLYQFIFAIHPERIFLNLSIFLSSECEECKSRILYWSWYNGDRFPESCIDSCIQLGKMFRIFYHLHHDLEDLTEWGNRCDFWFICTYIGNKFLEYSDFLRIFWPLIWAIGSYSKIGSSNFIDRYWLLQCYWSSRKWLTEFSG